MTEIMPVPRNLNLLSYQQSAFPVTFFVRCSAEAHLVSVSTHAEYLARLASRSAASLPRVRM